MRIQDAIRSIGRAITFRPFSCLFLILLLAGTGYAEIVGIDGIIHIPIIGAHFAKSPEGWKTKEWKGAADINVTDTDIGKTIHMKSKATSTALYKDIDLNSKQHPILNWKWKVIKLPANADVRSGSSDDQAAQVYVIFYKFPPLINSRVVGYIWDTTAPVGAVVASTKNRRTKYIVVESGTSEIGRWKAEKRNVHEDYKRLFNEEPPRVIRLSLMIDSDDTNSAAESFIGDIYFSNDASARN